MIRKFIMGGASALALLGGAQGASAQQDGNVARQAYTLAQQAQQAAAKLAVSSVPGLYNNIPANMLSWRVAAAKVRTGAANEIILSMGDSETAGAQANGTVSGLWSSAYPARLAIYLASLYGLPATSDAACGDHNLSGVTGGSITAYDPRLTLNGWAAGVGSERSLPTLGGYAFANSSDTTNLIFAPAAPVDSVDVYDIGNAHYTAGFDTTSPATDVNHGSGAAGLQKATLTTTLGAHTLSIARVAAAGNSHIVCEIAYNSAKKSVQVVNAGANSWQTGDWQNNTATYNPLSAAVSLAPALTIIKLGTNDILYGTGGSTAFTTNLSKIVSAMKAAGSSVLIVFPNPSNLFSLATAAPYRAAALSVAQAQGAVLLDLTDRYGSGAAIIAAGMMGSDPHFNALGYDDEARAIAQVVGGALLGN